MRWRGRSVGRGRALLIVSRVEVGALRGWLLLRLLCVQRRERVQGRKCRRRAVDSGVWTGRRGSANGTEVAVLGPSRRVWCTLRTAHRVDGMRQGAQSQSALGAATKRRRALPVVAPFAPQGLIGWGGRWAAAAIAVVDIVLHVLVQLLEQECALEAHLLDAAVQACDAQARAVVVLFNVGYAAAEVDAFAVVGAFDRRREVFGRDGAGRW